MTTPNLADYDFVFVNSSAGKDSQTSLRFVAKQAEREGYPKSRILVAHADLGDMEWEGAKELAEQQAQHYGFRFSAIARPQGDIIDHWLEKGIGPDSLNRWCTSDHKRDQITKLFTKTVEDFELIWQMDGINFRQVRILNVMGMRAEESKQRAKLKPFSFNSRASNGKRHIDTWLPIHALSLADVWKDIKESGVPHHFAYDLGMPRLSCKFCFFAPKQAWMIAGRRYPETLARYVHAEKTTNFTLKKNFPIEKVQQAIAAGEDWGPASDWVM